MGKVPLELCGKDPMQTMRACLEALMNESVPFFDPSLRDRTPLYILRCVDFHGEKRVPSFLLVEIQGDFLPQIEKGHHWATGSIPLG